MERVTRPTETLAEGVMDAAFRFAQLVRREVRRQRPAGLSVTQVRALSLLSRQAGASLADVAEYVGLGAPAASRMIEELVRSGLVLRESAPGDRRRLALRLSPGGGRALKVAQLAARLQLVAELERLTAAERTQLSQGMEVLRRVLANTGSPALTAGDLADE